MLLLLLLFSAVLLEAIDSQRQVVLPRSTQDNCCHMVADMYAFCDCAGGMPHSPAATFRSLPPRQILTLNFDAPEMWLVEPVVAEHDLDNLKLEQLGEASTLSAEFELEALMLTGRCIDRYSRRRDLVSMAHSLSVLSVHTSV